MTCQICAKANCIGECEPKIKPTVPDAIHHTDLGETLEYIQGWNDCRQAMLAEQPAQPHAWFTVDELNAWADKKLKENPQWAEQPAQQEPSDLDVWKARALQAEAVIEKFMAEQPAQQAPVPWSQALEDVWAEPDEVFPPAQQEPVAFPTRKAVEREIERTANPTGMHLNDGKERVALPGGTLRHMLALIDRTSPPAQRTWVGLTDEDIRQCSRDVVAGGPENSVDRFAYAIEAKLKEKNT